MSGAVAGTAPNGAEGNARHVEVDSAVHEFEPARAAFASSEATSTPAIHETYGAETVVGAVPSTGTVASA